VNQIDRAQKVGISQGYFWKIYNGYATPGNKVLPRLIKATGKPKSWWFKARLGQVQKVLYAIGE
jgi:transcriptional regulator with XRE-family HTH domain